MYKFLTEDRIEEYEKFVWENKKGHFMQSKLWHKIKNNWINEIVISVDSEDKIRGGMSILIRKVPFINSTLMYAPRGPVCDVHNEEIIKELTDGARALAKKYKSYVLKIDPDVKSDDKEFADILKKNGYSIKSASKNFEGIQPCYVFRMDVKDKTEEEVFSSFHSKTRYNIRLAERKGVKTRIGNRDDLKRFHEIMCETGDRDEFVVRNLEYFERMYDAMSPDYLRLYMAEHEGEDIAGTIAVYYGNKVWYLYGASSNAKRNVMPNYALQWDMIKWSIEKKCDIYDFRGVSGDIDESNPLYGLYRFKKGFNGEFTEFIGEAELIFNKPLEMFINTAESTYRELRRKIYLLRGQK